MHRPGARQGASRLRARRPVRGGARAVPDRHRRAWPTSSCRPPCSSSTPTSTRPARTRRSRSTSRSWSRSPSAAPTTSSSASWRERLGAEHPGFAMTEWELIDDLLPPLRLARRRDRPRRRRLEHRARLPQGAPSGRLPDAGRPLPLQARLGEPRPARPPDAAGCPTTCRPATSRRPPSPTAWWPHPSRQFLNSTFTEMPTSVKREQRPTALLNPDTMAQLGLADGDPVRLGNERGSLVLHAKARPGQQETTIVVESIWPNRYWAGGHRRQPAAERRPRPAQRRCRDPRHGGVAGAGAPADGRELKRAPRHLSAWTNDRAGAVRRSLASPLAAHRRCSTGPNPTDRGRPVR